jgi:beta-lactamase class A
MRRISIVCVVSIIVLGCLAAPAEATTWKQRMRRAITFAEGRAGSISFAVVDQNRRFHGYRAGTDVAAASVLKVMLMAAYLRRPAVRDRALTDDERSLLGPMIRRSDDTAASRIRDAVGTRGMERLARDAKMHSFRFVYRPWGASIVNAAEQSRFMARLGRYIPDRHERYARYLLSHIVQSQRWGIGQVVRPDWRYFFKGGWGSGSGAVCHQVAYIKREGLKIAYAVMITNSPSHSYGTDTLRGIFGRLMRDLPRPG